MLPSIIGPLFGPHSIQARSKRRVVLFILARVSRKRSRRKKKLVALIAGCSKAHDRPMTLIVSLKMTEVRTRKRMRRKILTTSSWKTMERLSHFRQNSAWRPTK